MTTTGNCSSRLPRPCGPRSTGPDAKAPLTGSAVHRRLGIPGSSRRSAPRMNQPLAAALLLLGGCAMPQTMTEARIARIDQAVGASQQTRSKYLRYAVESDEGTWTREIVIAPGAYAEQRTRRTDGAR